MVDFFDLMVILMNQSQFSKRNRKNSYWKLEIIRARRGSAQNSRHDSSSKTRDKNERETK